jgi:pimeloyl-ACP methyl ester carboxylesterase
MPMTWTPFATGGAEPTIAGRLAGAGPRVLLVHGGPGMNFDYLRDLAEELARDHEVAWYQQRGLEPSSTDGPFTVGENVADARRVLDRLGWDTAYVVGHSWGGQLVLHIATALPERVSGVLAVDPLGSVGDGRWPEFDAEIFRRTPEAVRERARALDEQMMAGDVTDDLAVEQMGLIWPAYFADPSSAPPMPAVRLSPACMSAMHPSILAELPGLAARLPAIRVPVGFVHGAMSPMPITASTDAADRIPGAWVDVVDGAGHFIWVESPGAVGRALRRLTNAATAPESPS